MDIIDRIRNIPKTKWYNQEAWVRTEQFYITETLEKYGCPSWDVGLCKLKHYKHKENCEERWRLVKELGIMNKEQITTTVFDDPAESDVRFGWPTDKPVGHISNFDVTVYSGGDYE